ncbi:hypothetical protein PSTT_13658, partial [Puccinia striiformis]
CVLTLNPGHVHLHCARGAATIALVHQKTLRASFRSDLTIRKMDPSPVGTFQERNAVATRPSVPPCQDEENMVDFQFDDRADHLSSPDPSEPDESQDLAIYDTQLDRCSRVP